MRSSIIQSSILLIFGFCFLFGTLILRGLFSVNISIGIYVGSILIIIGVLKSFSKRNGISSHRLSSRLTLFIKLFVPMTLCLVAIIVISFISRTLNETDSETLIFLVVFIILYSIATLLAIILLVRLKNVYYSNKSLFIQGKVEEQIILDNISYVKMIFPGLFKIKLKNKREVYFTPSFLDSLLKIGLTSSKIDELKKDLKINNEKLRR